MLVAVKVAVGVAVGGTWVFVRVRVAVFVAVDVAVGASGVFVRVDIGVEVEVGGRGVLVCVAVGTAMVKVGVGPQAGKVTSSAPAMAAL